MEERITLTNIGGKFIEGQITKEEFVSFFENFKSGIANIKEELKKTVEPMIYNNPDSKKISEKSNALTSLLEDMDRGIRVIESSIGETSDMDKFKRGYQTILTVAEKMESFKQNVSVLANSTPM